MRPHLKRRNPARPRSGFRRLAGESQPDSWAFEPRESFHNHLRAEPSAPDSARMRGNAICAEGTGALVAPLAELTRSDYHMTMRAIRIAELKTNLSRYLRSVRRGHTLVVLDRETPIARIVPYLRDPDGLVVQEPDGEHARIQDVPLPPPLEIDGDIVDLLLEERQGDR